MTWKDQRRLLLAAAAALTAGAAAILAWSALGPLDRGDGPLGDRRKPQSATIPTRRVDPIGAYAVVYQRDLRKPLFDPEAPKAEVAKPPPPPPLTVTLKGTVVEEGFSYAVLRDKGGEEKLLKVGESLGGAEVVAIAEGEATLRFHGQTITLKAQLKEGP